MANEWEDYVERARAAGMTEDRTTMPTAHTSSAPTSLAETLLGETASSPREN
jgi:hypothetical protein